MTNHAISLASHPMNLLNLVPKPVLTLSRISELASRPIKGKYWHIFRFEVVPLVVPKY